jgi:hypothetical protein
MAKIDWHSLAATISSLSEHEVKALLDEEVSTHRRPVMARRLHQRYASLRTSRERAEIMEAVRK